jgi:hypothetical protein
MDEVGEDVRYSGAAHPGINYSWPFSSTVFEYILSRMLDGLGAFRLIFAQSTCVSHHLDGECQPDSVASLNEDQTHA